LNEPQTGDAANHTLQWVKDGVAAAPTNAPSELDATNAPGVYKVALTAAEAGCELGAIVGKSSTTNVVIEPTIITFERLPVGLAGSGSGVPTVQDVARIVRVARQTYFVRADGSDLNDGLSYNGAFATPTKAAQTATAGDTVIIFEGAYSLGTTTLLSAGGVHWIGAGIDVTKINGSPPSSFSVVTPGTGDRWENLTIIHSGSPGFAFGSSGTGSNVNFQNVTCRRVKFTSHTDFVVLSDNGYQQGIRFEDCLGTGTFDGVSIIATGSNGVELEMIRCHFATASTGGNNSRPLQVITGGSSARVRIVAEQCTFFSDRTGAVASNAEAVWLSGVGIQVDLLDCAIWTQPGSAPGVLALDITAIAGAVARVNSGTTFDEDRVSGTLLFAPDGVVAHAGTAQGGAAATITLSTAASPTNDLYKGNQIRIQGGTGVGQVREITAYNGTTKVVTIAPNWEAIPDNTSVYAVLAQMA
jgi:hypothetical protein